MATVLISKHLQHLHQCTTHRIAKLMEFFQIRLCIAAKVEQTQSNLVVKAQSISTAGPLLPTLYVAHSKDEINLKTKLYIDIRLHCSFTRNSVKAWLPKSTRTISPSISNSPSAKRKSYSPMFLMRLLEIK